MTFTITKTKLAVSLVAVVMAAASAAFAGVHPFKDVPKVGDPGQQFYSEPVQWLWDNSLTTGSPSGSDTFKPLDNVTRGENATFNFRYDKNVVQPALAAIEAAVGATEADVDALQADDDADTVDGLHANDLARVAYENDTVDVDNAVVNNDHDLSVTAPVDGVFVVTTTVILGKDNSDETGTGFREFFHTFLLDGVDTGDQPVVVPINFDTSLDNTLNNSVVIPVTAGTYTITGRTSGMNATFVAFIYGRRIVAEFIPFGDDGLTATSKSFAVPAAGDNANS
jgi:hypothetical protein